MPLYLIEAPDPEDVLPLADAKAHLRVDFDDEDDLIRGYIGAAIGNLDGRDGWLGRALGEQTWELRLPRFPASPAIEVPLPPLIEVESVTYYDAGDVLQTLSAGAYEVAGVGGLGKARVVLKTGQLWPDTARRAESVLVRFRCGYPTTGSPALPTVPPPIRVALLRIMGSMYEERQDVVIGVSATRLPGGVEPLLAPLRVW
jgi:uncharacterized phiE125 gp8 family phage protein